MSDVTKQQGALVMIGFKGNTYTGYFMDTVGHEDTGDIAEVRDENDATATKIISNPGSRIKVAMIAKDAATPLTINKGDGITVNMITYMVEDRNISYSRGATRVEITAIKEDSMTYSATATASSS